MSIGTVLSTLSLVLTVWKKGINPSMPVAELVRAVGQPREVTWKYSESPGDRVIYVALSYLLKDACLMWSRSFISRLITEVGSFGFKVIHILSNAGFDVRSQRIG